MSAPIVVTYRYADAAAAIDFLCDAFGFTRQVVHEGADGRIDHAQLTFGTSMVMVSSPRDNAYEELVGTVAEGGRSSVAPYVVVDDPRAHCEHARAHGARILLEPEEQDYGGVNYTCADPEGNVWNFGSYDPWVGTGQP